MQYRVNPAFIVQKIGKKTGVYDAEKSVMHTFNDSAGYIFLGLQLQWSKDKIVEKLMEKYKVKKNVAQTDLETAMEDMMKKKILLKEE